MYSAVKTESYTNTSILRLVKTQFIRGIYLYDRFISSTANKKIEALTSKYRNLDILYCKNNNIVFKKMSKDIYLTKF